MSEISNENIINIADHSFGTNAYQSDLFEIYRYGEPFVSIEQFLSDDYYMGRIAKDLYPENKPDLLDIFNPEKNYFEIIFTGATSIGKTFCTAIAITYIIGQLSAYVNPHRQLGASSASPIVIINMSISAQKAKEIVFTRVKTMLDASPFFREKFRRDMRLSDSLNWRISQIDEDMKTRTGSSIIFKPGTGESLSALGDDVYAAAIDEANFFRVIEKSRRARDAKYDPAQELYDTIFRRLKGRYGVGGKVLGKIFLLSSATYPDAFIERRIIEAEEDGSLGDTVKVVRKSTWEAKRGVFLRGSPIFGDHTFRVEIGSSRRASRLLDTYDKKKDEIIVGDYADIEGKVINVPIELWSDFRRDLEGSVRDFAGECSRAIAPFILDVSIIYDAVERAEKEQLTHPWTNSVTTLLDGSNLVVSKLFEQEMDEAGNLGKWRPKRHPEKPRFFHIDLGKTGDSAGIGIVHEAGWTQVMNREGIWEDHPVIELDLALRVSPPPGGEIPYSNIRGILTELRNHGMYFAYGSYDTYQSVGEVQTLRSLGFTVEATRDSDDQYLVLKNALFDRRMVMYFYDPLVSELTQLEDTKGHIDHREGGSDDVARSVARAVFNLFQRAKHMSEKDMKAALPRKAEKPVVETKRVQMKSAEEELKKFMGGGSIVRR